MSNSLNGLLAAWRLDGKGSGVELTLEEVEQAPKDALVWVHLDYGDPATAGWLHKHSGLPIITIEALLADEPRPRSVVVGTGLLSVLRGINTNQGADPEDMVSLRMWLDEHRIITVRRRRLRTVSEISDALRANAGPNDTGDFLVDVLNGMTDRISTTVSEVDDEADALEDAMLDTGSRELRKAIGSLRRQVIALRRYISPQRDAVARLQSERVTWLDDLHRARLREAADRVTRCVEDLEAVRDRAAVTQEELNNRIAEQMNSTMYVLSIVAAIFLPLGLLTGLLGINVGGMPGVDSPYAFWSVTAGLVVLGVGLAAFFRRQRLI